MDDLISHLSGHWEFTLCTLLIIVYSVIQLKCNIKVHNFKYCAHIFYLFSVNKAFTALRSTWLAHDLTIHIQSYFTIQPNTNKVFGQLFDTEANTKRIFGTALVVTNG